MVAIIAGSPGRRLPCLSGRLPRAYDVNGEVGNISDFGCCIRCEVVAGIGGIHTPLDHGSVHADLSTLPQDAVRFLPLRLVGSW